MKRAAVLLLLILVAGMVIHQPVDAVVLSEYEVVKGTVVDSNGDGRWDYLDFDVQIKNAKLSIPVISVSVVTGNPNNLSTTELPFTMIEVTRRLDKYVVDLSVLKLTDTFSLNIKLDISEIIPDSDDNIVDGGPGPIPNETVLVIDYP